jgi:hypothetical protein
MRASNVLAAFIILTAFSLAGSQTTFPDSGRYVPLKFDVGTGGAKISTVEGENNAVTVSDIGTQGPFSEGVSAKNVGFVKASGTQFYVDGKPYFCAGTNAYYAGLQWIMSDGEVAVMMKVSLFIFEKIEII